MESKAGQDAGRGAGFRVVTRDAILHRIYQRVNLVYWSRPGGEGSTSKVLLRALLWGVVRTLMAWHGVRFPPRAIGGFWAHWGWRLEVLMGWLEPESIGWCR